MTARILVVDDIPANLRLLEARLTAEYFDVVTADNGEDALRICQDGEIDVVLLDIMMPGMDGFEVCERLKADVSTMHIPVVFVTALDETADRIRGLEVGADDFLTKPVNDMQLMARVKSLVRLKALTDELRLRAATSRDIGLQEIAKSGGVGASEKSSVLIVDDRASSADRLGAALKSFGEIIIENEAESAVFLAAESQCDCIIISAGLSVADPLRLCSQLRSLDRTRNIPIILVAESEDRSTIERALELGVNDYILRPVEPQELMARARTQIRRRRFHDHLRRSLASTIELAVTDSLTGLSNRRYLDTHLDTLIERARARRQQLSILICDIDHFKQVNDRHGHDSGDDVLRTFAKRIRECIRNIDLVCRYGGEEFVVVMPGTDAATATVVAERLRVSVANNAFRTSGDDVSLAVTVSIGVATLADQDADGRALVKRADQALYTAKHDGRNRVVAKAA
jgi:two-component system cell cycle response regulator